MDREQVRKLFVLAEKARERAYVPYSGFSVGAALLTEQGEIFTGCNIENRSYPAGLCAERVAVFSAIAAGYDRFRSLVVTGGMKGEKPEDFCIPCGMCLQVLSEFCSPDFEICLAKSADDLAEYRLEDFLPYVFDSLDKKIN